MNILQRIGSWIDWFNTNPVMQSINIHGLFGLALISILARHFALTPLILTYVAITAGKEYWFDARYETPKQDFKGSSIDFSGYMLGMASALALRHFGI